MASLSGSPTDDDRAPVSQRDAQVVGERGRGREGHRGRAGRPRLPRGFEEETGKRADERALQHQAEGALAVSEHEEGRHEDHEVQVDAADRRGARGRVAARGAVGRAEREPPGWRADGEKRDRQAGLLAVELARLAEVVEDERQSSEPAGLRGHRDLRADPQKVGYREHDHVDRDQRDDIEVRTLDRREGATLVHEARIMRLEEGQNVRTATLRVSPALATARLGKG